MSTQYFYEAVLDLMRRLGINSEETPLERDPVYIIALDDLVAIKLICKDDENVTMVAKVMNLVDPADNALLTFFLEMNAQPQMLPLMTIAIWKDEIILKSVFKLSQINHATFYEIFEHFMGGVLNVRKATADYFSNRDQLPSLDQKTDVERFMQSEEAQLARH